MSDHSNITSLIRSLLSGSSMSSDQQKKTSSNSSIPPYISSSIYNKKKKKKTPKRFTFDLAFYNNPGDIMKGNTIDEKKMVQTGNGNIVLYEHNNAEDVKTELLKLLSTITETNDLENLDLIYLKREGRKKQFRKHFCSSSFVYDATGLKYITGRDSKSLHIVISKFIDFNNFNELTLHTLATINTTNVNGSSDSNSNIFVESPFKISFPTNESRSRKSKKIQQRQRAVTITETSWINNVNNVSPRGILTIFNHFYFLQFV